jgi:hypothetical protein
LRSLRTGLPGVRDFPLDDLPEKVEAVYGTERKLREGRQIHARKVRQAATQVVLGVFSLLKRLSNGKKPWCAMTKSSEPVALPESLFARGSFFRLTLLSLAMASESPALPDPPTPYSNGSYLVSNITGYADLLQLYCSCSNSPSFHAFKWSELKAYAVSDWAHERG